MTPYPEHRLTTKQIVVFFLLFAMLFHLDKVILGPYAPIRIHDSFDAEFGRYFGLGNLILKHGFFSWNPNMAGGMPSFAYHFGPFHILVLLSIIFPLWLINHFLVILLMALAGYGMHRFIRDFTDTPQQFALFGGLLFALNSQLQISSLPFVPFVFVFPFFFLCLHGSSNASTGPALASRFFWLILFAWWSYPTLTIAFPVLHLVLIFFFTPLQKASRKQWLLQFCLYWVGYSLFYIPSVHTLLDFIPFQHRLYPEAVNLSIPAAKYFYNFLEYTWHTIFTQISIRALIFPVLIASIPLIIISREVRRFAYLLAFFIIIAGISGSDLAGLYAGTFLEKMETRLSIYLVPFAMTLYGVAVIKTLGQQPKKIRYICMSLVIGSLIYLYNLESFYGINAQITPAFKILNALVALGIFLYVNSTFLAITTSSSTRKITRNTTWVLILIMLIGMLGISKFLRFVAMENKIYKRHFESHSVFREIADKAKSSPLRVAMIGNRPSIAETYGLEYTGGRGPLYNRFYKDYFKLLVSPQLMRDPKKKIFFETYNYELFLQVRDQSHPEFKYNLQPSVRDWNLPLLLAANIKYVISNRIISGMNQFATSVRIDNGEWYDSNSPWTLKPWEITDRMISSFELMRIGPVGRRREPVRYFIYEMKDNFQRAYLASEITVLSTREEVLESLGEATIKDLGNRAYLAKEDAEGIGDFPVSEKSQLEIPAPLEFLTYEPDRMTVQATTQGPRMLIISNNYDPKWKAFVNGQETKIIRANHAFQGILLPISGKNRIELIYSDPILPWLFITIPFGILLVFAAARLYEKPSNLMNDAKSSMPARHMR